MTRFARTDVINTIYERGLLPSFSTLDPASDASIVKACTDGGARAILYCIENKNDIQTFDALVEELDESDPGGIWGSDLIGQIEFIIDIPARLSYPGL
jgi:hypothetical protein